MNETLRAMAHSQTLQIIVAVVVTVYVICLFLDARNRNVAIGISDTIAKQNRHGVAWVRDEHEKVVGKQFLVDQPHLLTVPNRYQIRDIFEQIKMLGFVPDHLEILVGDKVRVYRPDQVHPILIAAR